MFRKKCSSRKGCHKDCTYHSRLTTVLLVLVLDLLITCLEIKALIVGTSLVMALLAITLIRGDNETRLKLPSFFAFPGRPQIFSCS